MTPASAADLSGAILGPGQGALKRFGGGYARKGLDDRGPGVSALADALLTASRQRVLALPFGRPNREFFVTETIALAG